MSISQLWPDPPVPTPSGSGDGVLKSGSDANADGGGGAAALQSPYDNAPYKSTDGAESANSVSGLPALPNRFEPSEGAPDPPSLQDRRPGTIDKR